MNGCAGLVRSRTSFGLRFATDDYEAAWKILCPDRQVPAAQDTPNLFQIQSLPYGCSAEMLTKWSESIGWAFKPLKALGPTGWLVGSKEQPPAEFLTFNAKPVLVKFIQPKDSVNTSPIVAGPLPSKSDSSQKAATATNGPLGGPLSFDPWAKSAQGKGLPPAFTREQTGPSEMKFKEQDGKIEAQNQKLAEMENAIEQLRQDTKSGFEQVHQREQQAQAQVHAAIKTVKQDLEHAFQQAICQQSNQLNGTLQELRSLLQTKPKRGRSEESNGMEQWRVDFSNAQRELGN